MHICILVKHINYWYLLNLVQHSRANLVGGCYSKIMLHMPIFHCMGILYPYVSEKKKNSYSSRKMLWENLVMSYTEYIINNECHRNNEKCSNKAWKTWKSKYLVLNISFPSVSATSLFYLFLDKVFFFISNKDEKNVLSKKINEIIHTHTHTFIISPCQMIVYITQNFK